MHSDSSIRLFEIDIELTEELTALHIEFAQTEDEVEKAIIKGKMKLFWLLQEIIKMRLKDVRKLEETTKLKTENERKELLVNRQFRIKCLTTVF